MMSIFKFLQKINKLLKQIIAKLLIKIIKKNNNS